MRYASSTDDCQPEIVKALRAIGASVYLAKLPLDLLVAFRRKGDTHHTTLLIECKDADRQRSTQAQAEFIATWPGEFHVCLTPEQAVAAVIGKEAMA